METDNILFTSIAGITLNEITLVQKSKKYKYICLINKLAPKTGLKLFTKDFQNTQ